MFKHPGTLILKSAGLFLWLCLPVYSGFAQSPQLPLQFQQFFRNYALLNPASIGREDQLEGILSHRSYVGALSGVNKFYLNANYRLNASGESKPKHALGAIFSSDQIGPYIGSSRGYALYAVHIPLKPGVWMNAGTSIGFANYYYQATQLYAGSSSATPTGDLGLWLYTRKMNLGLCVNQLYSGKLSPFNQSFTLSRNINLNADRTFYINPELTLTSILWMQWVNKEYYQFNMALNAVYRKLISAGLSYKVSRGLTFFIGAERISIGTLNMKILSSYYTGSRNPSAFEVQSVEFSLIFLLNQNAEEEQ